MKKKFKQERKIWNEAVRATVKEIGKWDGVITDYQIRKYMQESIEKKLLYKRL